MASLVERAGAKFDRETVRSDSLGLDEVRRAVDSIVVQSDVCVAPACAKRVRTKLKSKRSRGREPYHLSFSARPFEAGVRSYLVSSLSASRSGTRREEGRPNMRQAISSP